MFNYFDNILFLLMLLVALFYVLFGQVTVRKLRKNSETKNSLGMELYGGYDIINVAQALSIPRSWARKLDEKSRRYSFGTEANSDLLYENTTKFDRILARLTYWLMVSFMISVLLYVILETTGFYALKS